MAYDFNVSPAPYESLIEQFKETGLNLAERQKRLRAPSWGRRGILTSPYSEQFIQDIDRAIAEAFAPQAAQLGVRKAEAITGLEKWKKSMGFAGEQFEEQKRQFSEQLNIQKRMLKSAEDARKQAIQNQLIATIGGAFLGPVVGGVGAGLGGWIGKLLGAGTTGTGAMQGYFQNLYGGGQNPLLEVLKRLLLSGAGGEGGAGGITPQTSSWGMSSPSYFEPTWGEYPGG